LFVADREDHCSYTIDPHLEKMNVVCDRYYYSTMVYQALEHLDCWDDMHMAKTKEDVIVQFEGILASHLFAHPFLYEIITIRPDMAIVLNADPDVLIERVKDRRGEVEIYDNRIRAVSMAYQWIFEWMNGIIERTAQCFSLDPYCRDMYVNIAPDRQVVIDVSSKAEEKVFQEAVLSVDALLNK
jgi:thymidylate kinase